MTIAFKTKMAKRKGEKVGFFYKLIKVYQVALLFWLLFMKKTVFLFSNFMNHNKNNTQFIN